MSVCPYMHPVYEIAFQFSSVKQSTTCFFFSSNFEVFLLHLSNFYNIDHNYRYR